MKISWVRGNNVWAFRFLTSDLTAALPDHQHVFNETTGADIYYVVEPALFNMIPNYEWKKCVVHLDSMRVFERGVNYAPQISTAGAVVAGNRKLFEMAARLNKKTYLIPNGLPLDVWKPTARPAGFVVGFAGSLKSPAHIEYKGYNLVEQVCQLMGLSLHTALYGPHQIAREEMRANFYSKISCLVQPTKGEGCSMIISEALACGVPVLTTKEAGYHGEELRDGENVMFVSRDVQAIRYVLSCLRQNAALQATLVSNGLQFASQRHNIEAIARQHKSIFEDCQARTEPRAFTVPLVSARPVTPYKEAPVPANIREYKPRVVVYVDDQHWCYFTTVQQLVKRLADQFDFTLIASRDLRKMAGVRYDLIWGRGYYHLMLPLFNMFGGANKCIYTITTGGEMLAERISRNFTADKDAIGIITQCPDTFNQVAQRWGATRLLWQVPNGIDTEMFVPALDRPENFVLGYSGRTVGITRYQKGIDLVTGVCEDNGFLFRMADKENMIPHAQMPAFYQSLSCYVQPSLSEGCSNSVMEAMACGLPCLIIKGVGYHGQVCTDREVVFVDRTRPALTAKIKWLRDNPGEAREIGQAAREFALRHGWDATAGKYRDILWQALQVSAAREITIPIDGRGYVLVMATRNLTYMGTKTTGTVFQMRQKHVASYNDKVSLVNPANYILKKTPLQLLVEARTQ